MDEHKVKVIKISSEALFEFICEKFAEGQECYFDTDPLEVSNTFAVDWNNGRFIFCAHKAEDSEGNFIEFPSEIDLQKLLQTLPDTTTTMFGDGRYREYTKQDLIELSK